ncbi:hypothetical protein [uncultured Pelagimonas sp.]|uniref:hypothetical protein n=1 Tax=uncultured Pelagimonas sp. TaxID=1618102 RepID=UPI002610B745|nr:hypothetical protein [uncultured Pelagimonas sp.]
MTLSRKQNILPGPIDYFDQDAAAGGTAATPPFDPPITVNRDGQWGWDTATGDLIERVAVTLSDGTETITDYINGVPLMTLSSNFSPDTSVDVERSTAYATNTTVGDAQYGRVVELDRHMPFKAGVLQENDIKFWDMTVTPPVDQTAIVTVAPFTLAEAPIRLQLAGEALAITGAAGVALAAIPATATYAEIYIEDANLRWTKDGSAPADNNGEQESTGGTIRLLDRAEIEGFLALTIDANGDLDAALTANVTVNYWNVAPDED